MKKVWTSTLDDKTRDTHQALDGEVVGMDEDFISPSGARGSAPGLLGDASEDINCRCSLRYEVMGMKSSVRREGRGGIIPYTTYKEWAQDKGIKPQYSGAEPKVDLKGNGLMERVLEAEDGIKNEPIEHCYAFDDDGNIVFKKTGSNNAISFNDEECKLFENRVFTHNHPMDSSFSDADIRTACGHNVKEIRAIGRNNIHSVKRPSKGWDSDYFRNYIYPLYKKYDAEIRNEFQNKIFSGRITVEYANANHYHEVWSRVFNDLGIEYSREVRKK
jgi:hypothetical protein